MQPIKLAIQVLFNQLESAIAQLPVTAYSQPSQVLLQASVGQHVRHVIELFQCLEQGYDRGKVNYDLRKRDLRIETDPQLAIRLLYKILSELEKTNKNLLLEAAYDVNDSDSAIIATNYYRELVYNLEHTVHHMALIRVGVQEVSDLVLPAHFGVASSTIKYRAACAQ